MRSEKFLFNGGPEWAAESTLGFKIQMSLRLIPWYLVGVYLLYCFINTMHQRKWVNTKPKWYEYMVGVLWFLCYAVQIVTKIQSQTLIFILNPCHVITLVWGVIHVTEYNRFSQILYLYALSNIASPYMGMVFAENDELEMGVELTSYWIQHCIAAIVWPVVSILSGRYAHNDYFKPHYIMLGYQFFTLYMRVFLTPISAWTWANLNHTLCGVDNDPCRRWFDLKEYYYFYSEFYLITGSWMCAYWTLAFCNLVRPSVFKQNKQLLQKSKTD